MFDNYRKVLKDPVVLGGFVQAFREQRMFGGLHKALVYHGPLFKVTWADVTWTEVADEEAPSAVQAERV